mgnify:CR=1 FL=1
MRILIVTWFFPPANTMGALRVGKFADFLVRQGHEVRVVTADFKGAAPPLDTVPPCPVVRTGWWDVNALPQRLIRPPTRRSPASAGAAAAETGADPTGPAGDAGPSRPGLKRRLGRAYQALTNFPDKRVGWIPHAVRAGRRELAAFDADVVFASAPPFSTLVAGALLARRAGKPYVVEMRDRWSDDPYRVVSRLRGWLERRLESWVMRQATGIVTVSEPWARQYAQLWTKPTETVLNGFDPADIARAAARPARPAEPDVLVISHVGRIYPGRRDPSVLLQAIRQLGAAERRQIRVDFVGENEGIAELADRHDVRDNVHLVAPLPYLDALRRQMDSDIVLLLQWDDPAEQGNVPGKLFEYLATHRPILGHGYTDGVPARIIAQQGAGLYSNDPEAVAQYLAARLAEKQRTGRVTGNPDTVAAGFDRDTAYAKLTTFMASLTKTQ